MYFFSLLVTLTVIVTCGSSSSLEGFRAGEEECDLVASKSTCLVKELIPDDDNSTVVEISPTFSDPRSNSRRRSYRTRATMATTHKPRFAVELDFEKERVKALVKRRQLVAKRAGYSDSMIRAHIRWQMSFIQKFTNAVPKTPYRSWGPLAKVSWYRRKKSLCALKALEPVIYSGTEWPFNMNPLGKYMPRTKQLPNFGSGKSCAVVSSAGSILETYSGPDIDKHDVVARMNSAYVGIHAGDIGSRTTFRIVNDQVLASLTAKPSGGWAHITDVDAAESDEDVITFGWDFCGERNPEMLLDKCHGNLKREDIFKFKGHGYNGLANYMRWTEHNRKDLKVFVLDNKWLNKLKRYVESESPFKKQPSILPSSGFIAMVMLMNQCRSVHLYHMIPPVANRGACKFNVVNENKRALECSLFPMHNREGELAFMMTHDKASIRSTYLFGHALMPGLSKLKCPKYNFKKFH